MTDEEINVLVAEKIFGEVEVHAPCDDGLTRTYEFCDATMAEAEQRLREAYARRIERGMKLWPAIYIGPDYCTDIADAWRVVEKMGERGFDSCVNDSKSWPDGQLLSWHCCFHGEEMHHEYADTAPRAIALAALRAVGVEVDS